MKITRLKKLESKHKITYKDKTIFIGSCFSEAIGFQMKQLKFDVSINPFGTVFNPVSISNLMDFSVPCPKRIVQLDDVFLHLDYHSDIYSYSQDELMKVIKKKQMDFISSLRKSQTIFITLGTSWVYKYQEKEVNNCHKQNPNFFIKNLLSYNAICNAIQNTISQIKKINHTINIVFTISPVRHIKEGLIENNLSKSLLNVALHRVIKTEQVFYFPAFEITIDELRDYKYYDKDGIHPNTYGKEKVFDVFSNTFFSNETKEIINKVRIIKERERHKLKFPKSINAIKFAEKTKKDLSTFIKEYPYIIW